MKSLKLKQNSKRFLAVTLSMAVGLAAIFVGDMTAEALDQIATRGADYSFAQTYWGNAVGETPAYGINELQNDGWVGYKFDEPLTDADTTAEPETVDKYFMTRDGSFNVGYPKSRTNEGKGHVAMTFTRQRFKNFRAEYTAAVAWSRAGIMIGEMGEFPFSKDDNSSNDTGLTISVETEGHLTIAGAIEPNTERVAFSENNGNSKVGIQGDFDGANNVRVTNMANPVTVQQNSNKYLESAEKVAAASTTIVVEVVNGVCTVWDKSLPEQAVSVRLSENYRGGYISQFTKDGNSSFIDIKMTALNDYDYEYGSLYGKTADSADNANLKSYGFSEDYEYVGEKNFSENASSQYNGQSSNNFLKHKGEISDAEYTTFTYTKQAFKNFEAKVDVLPSHANNGIMFGAQKGVFPISSSGSDTGVVIRMDSEGKVYVGGAIDNTKVTAPEGVTVDPDNNLFSADKGFSTTSITGGKSVSIPTKASRTGHDAFSLCIQVQDGVLSIWEENFPQNTVSVELNGNYNGGYVSMYSQTVNNGAFKGFGVTAGEDLSLDLSDTANDDTINSLFTAYHFATATSAPEKATIVSEMWARAKNGGDKIFTNAPEYGMEGYWASNFLKPRYRRAASGTEDHYTLLSYKEQVQNFSASVKYNISHTNYGIMIAEEATIASIGNGIKISVVNSGLNITGAVDGDTATWSGSGSLNVEKNNYGAVVAPAYDGYQSPQNAWTDLNKTLYTLNVEVKGDVLKVWLSEFDGVLTVKLAAGYQGGLFSLYSVGGNQGGFEQIYIDQLEDSTTTLGDVEVTAQKEVKGELLAVTLKASAPKVRLKADISAYGAYKESTCTSTVAMTMTDQTIVKKADDTVSVDVIFNDLESSLILYFDIADAEEAAVTVTNGTVNGIGGIKGNMNAVVSHRGDANNDGVVDVRDLVSLKKGIAGLTGTGTYNRLNARVDREAVDTVQNHMAMRKLLIGTLGAFSN